MLDGHYAYNPLESSDSIRLLTLHPGHHDDLITCTLSHTSIGARQYRALSYEWGDEHDLGGIITVNGVPFPRRIQKNLESALREIRSEEDVVLWIDALCINQDEAAEKGHQVAMMGKIFRGAHRVIAWLGSEAENSEMAMDLIADTTTLREKAKQRQLEDTELGALNSIAYRSYWSRVWIMQEFFLAKSLEIRCGTKAVSYDGFANYIDAMSLPNSQFREPPWKRGPNLPPSHPHIIGRLIPPTTDPGSMLYNVHLFSWLRRSYDCRSQASNSRDYIYAFLGVSDDCVPGELVPDYNDNEETVREALLRIVPICLKSMNRLYRKYSDRQAMAGFFIKYAQKMGITPDAELLRDIARLMYINSEDLDLEEETGSEINATMYSRRITANELATLTNKVRNRVDFLASWGRPVSETDLYSIYKRLLFPSLENPFNKPEDSYLSWALHGIDLETR